MHSLTFHHYEDTHHLTQLYAGIGLLAKKGLVRCAYERSPAYQILGFGAQILTLTLNGQRKIAYDMDDSDRVIPEILQWSDVISSAATPGRRTSASLRKSSHWGFITCRTPPVWGWAGAC